MANMAEKLLGGALRFGFISAEVMGKMLKKVLEVSEQNKAEIDKQVNEIVAELTKLAKEKKLQAKDMVALARTMVEKKRLKLKADVLAEIHEFALALAAATKPVEQPQQREAPVRESSYSSGKKAARQRRV